MSPRFQSQIVKSRRGFRLRVIDTQNSNKIVGERDTCYPCLYACVVQRDQYYAQTMCEVMAQDYTKQADKLDSLPGVTFMAEYARKEAAKHTAEGSRLASGPQPEYQDIWVLSWHQRRSGVRRNPQYRILDIVEIDLRPLGQT
jgi:hypothetical protein